MLTNQPPPIPPVIFMWGRVARDAAIAFVFGIFVGVALWRCDREADPTDAHLRSDADRWLRTGDAGSCR